MSLNWLETIISVGLGGIIAGVAGYYGNLWGGQKLYEFSKRKEKEEKEESERDSYLYLKNNAPDIIKNIKERAMPLNRRKFITNNKPDFKNIDPLKLRNYAFLIFYGDNEDSLSVQCKFLKEEGFIASYLDSPVPYYQITEALINLVKKYEP